MAYNYPGAPGQYGQAPGYASAPGSMGPPGMNGAPGIISPQTPINGQGFPPNMKPPTNMPNINFNAPVIRLGTSGPPNNAPQTGRGRDSNTEPNHNRRGGLGLDRGGDRQQRPDFNLVPPTREEIFRTIFVGNIPEGVGGDAGMEQLLRCAGGLRRWTRAIDADDKPCKFGFAEYEDAESLETAAAVFKDIQVPLKKVPADATNGDAEVEKATLLFVVDAASQRYADEWHEKRQDDEATVQFRLDNARESLQNVLSAMFNPSSKPTQNKDGDATMQDVEQDPVTGEFVAISTAEQEDELSDIPAEMRETVAAEITAFRDRSIRRDIERQRKEEEEERERKERNRREMGFASGSSKAANGVPAGPADRGTIDAPKGPRGARGYQMPRDYQGNGNFVNASDGTRYAYITREEEDSDASDDELENRRRSKKEAIADKAYDDYERTWLIRERNRTNAIEREQRRTEDEEKNSGKRQEAMAERLRNWTEDKTKSELYHTDHSAWQRQRQTFRSREAQQDDADRRAEEAENARLQDRAQARDEADAFLEQQASEMATEPAQRQGVKISFGTALQKTQPAASKRRTAFEVEGLLDNEDDSNAAKRTLVPINPATLAEAAALTTEERQEAARQLAADIPSDKDGLWNWPVHWDSVTDEIVDEQLKPFVEKKIIEYLGVQEDMLVELVEQHIREHKGPQELVDELEGPLDEEAEVLVKKLWRMVIFFSESERRGLSA